MPSRYSKREIRHRKKIDKIRQKSLMKQEIRQEKEKYQQPMETYKKMSFWLMKGIAINGLAVELYSMFAMIFLKDLSALGSLVAAVIATPVAELIVLSVYCIKSFMSKREEENLIFERDKMNREM